ncbi:MAG: PD40 domain-containing protein [Spirochaetales bacterium]|nr:PD40 domain-containing protein [Spirochaetales bacterium]
MPVNKGKKTYCLLCMLCSVQIIVYACKPPVSSTPEKITIQGYTQDVMEPFISRDGEYLFFNNNETQGAKKDLFYAVRVSDRVFSYVGPLAAVNTAEVDGTPSLDAADNFYFLSLGGYNPGSDEWHTVFRGTWDSDTVIGSGPLAQLYIDTLLDVYFDIEVNADGTVLYLSRGVFSTHSAVPLTADIILATDSGSGFDVDPGSTAILENVNTEDALEYAAAISADGLRLYFNRFDAENGPGYPQIMLSTRTDSTGPFSEAVPVTGIDGFAEGPAFSPDEKYLYYHRQNPDSGLFEVYRICLE